MTGKMRAWIVSAYDGYLNQVWFAATRGKALFGVAEYVYERFPIERAFRVRRAPDLDEYLDYWLEKTDVPAQAWWARGDLAICAGCGWAVDQHGGHGEDDEEPASPPVVVCGEAYHAACAWMVAGMVG